MRNYENIDIYLDRLKGDIYDQPADEQHTAWAVAALNWAFGIVGIRSEIVKSVLDIGCGTGFLEPYFSVRELQYTGICMSHLDILKGAGEGRVIAKMDMSFMTYGDSSFDFLFARHVLEHSPMPLLSLMEWYRVSSKYLLLILPSNDYWGRGGINHYHVLDKIDWWVLFDRAKWSVVTDGDFTTSHPTFLKHYPTLDSEETWEGIPKVVEHWWLLEKK